MVKFKKADIRRFKRLLWSINPEKIDFEQDRIYIIHQVLAWGEPEDLRLLFKIYGTEEVKSVFFSHPRKVYTYPALRFVEILLGTKVDRSKYVSSIINSTS
uniref:DUF6922 domain-containing protein n=1 Tax=candidate division WOR-3 bacterium TaxID=2052148 RepID=A0A7C4TGD0_UNCW3